MKSISQLLDQIDFGNKNGVRNINLQKSNKNYDIKKVNVLKNNTHLVKNTLSYNSKSIEKPSNLNNSKIFNNSIFGTINENQKRSNSQNLQNKIIPKLFFNYISSKRSNTKHCFIKIENQKKTTIDNKQRYHSKLVSSSLNNKFNNLSKLIPVNTINY